MKHWNHAMRDAVRREAIAQATTQAAMRAVAAATLQTAPAWATGVYTVFTCAQCGEDRHGAGLAITAEGESIVGACCAALFTEVD